LRIASGGKEKAKGIMVQQTKVESVAQAVEKLGRSQAIVVVQYQGLTVKQMQDLRHQLREMGGELKVLKNRLAKRALAESKCDALDDCLTGATAVAFGYSDPTSPAKVCAKFAKTNDKLVIRGGLLGKKRIDAAKVVALSKLPGRTELLTQMAGTLLAPMRQMATAMNQAMAKIVYAMKARADQMGA
jgi:large subunit ribosomal protein L10